MAVYEVLLPPIGVAGAIVRDRYVELTEQQASGLIENGTLKLLPEAAGKALLADQNGDASEQPPQPPETPPPESELDDAGSEEVQDEATGENPQKLNLNTATLADLTTLKYVGQATAKKIIAGRPYDSIDEVIEASELAEERWMEILDQVEV